MTEADLAGRLRAWLDAAIDDPTIHALHSQPIAIGWATVDLDRAVDEVGAALALPRERFVHATGTALLGARCRVAENGVGRDLALVLLEPITEGRLAATLARHDEGPAALWVTGGDATGASRFAAARRGSAPGGHEQPGPFGLERLLPGPTLGPYRLAVGLAGTIQP
jgi:hypothetical protein